MREIKFRIFSKAKDDDGCEGYLETRSPVASGIDFYFDGGWRGISYFLNKDYFIVEQYTGLKDKDGKEIYEGDILASDANEKPCNYIVVWNLERSAQYCGFTLQPVMKDPPRVTYHIHDFKMWMAERFEIIGNIHENQDLLKNT